MASWFEREPGDVITLAVLLLIILVIGIYFLVRHVRAKRNPVEPKQARVVQHLLDRGFVVCDTGGMIIWPVDLELEETRTLRSQLANPDLSAEEMQAALVECYQDRTLSGIVGEHVVRLTRKRAEMFSSEEGPPRIELWVYLDQLNSHLDFDAKLSLERYCHADPDEGAEPFDSGHAGFDAFFPDRVGAKRAAARLREAGDTLDGVTRFAEKWGEQLDYARISGHIRLGLPAGVVLDAEDAGAVLDGFMNDAVALAGTIEAALAPSFVAREHVWVDQTIYARLEMLGSCPKCAAGMPLNGPLLSQQCSECLNEIELEEDLWDFLKWPLDEFIQGEGNVSSGFGKDATRLDWKICAPTCAGCGAALPVETVEIGSSGTIRCTECEAETTTFPPPDWLLEVAPGVEQLYAAEGAPGPAGEVSLALDGESHAPIAMTCPGCGGALMVSAEAERTIHCEYCDLDVFLPDALWKELHPARTTQPWWVRYSAPLPAEAAE